MAKRLVRRASGDNARRLRTPSSRIVTELGEIDLDEKTITNSARGTFLTCRRRYLLSYKHLLTRRETPHYFVVGSLVHDELERMYEDGGFKRGPAMKRIDRKTREALKEALSSDYEAKIWEVNALARGIVAGYAKHYLDRDLAKWEVLECEGSFSLPIPGTDWTYRGKRDMVVRLRVDDEAAGLKAGAVGLVENKTTAAIDTGYIARLPLDFQVLGYVWSMMTPKARRAFGDRPRFIEYNPMVKSRLRQRQNETRGQYLDRLEEDYRENPQKYFYRETVRFTKASVQGFVDELARFTAELDHCMATGYFSMNTRACTERGICEFMPICMDGPTEDTLLLYRRKDAVHEELGEDA